MNEEQNIDDSSQMADDSGEQPTVNSPLPIEQQPETLNLKPATSIMEVHHHPHVEKKSFKEYLLEGLMIFIAVTMGFIAENIREHITDNTKEKEYIVSMLKELKSDSIQLAEVFKDTIRIEKLDSLSTFLLSKDESQQTIKNVYRLSSFAVSFNAITFNRNTLTQLKSAGNMRLIRKQNVVDSLNKLDNLITELNTQLADYLKYLSENVRERYSVLDFSLFVKDGRRFKSDEVLNSATVFTYLTNDKKKVIEFGGHILSQRGALAVYFRMLKQYSTYSNALIIFLQKEYHLQHE
ncbi:MAG: hypothetical protein C0459_04750 [Chitinophaga sp.]|jgi:hypothetical protein|nr:hypothetical protein [Chitinophaga sp.]